MSESRKEYKVNIPGFDNFISEKHDRLSPFGEGTPKHPFFDDLEVAAGKEGYGKIEVEMKTEDRNTGDTEITLKVPGNEVDVRSVEGVVDKYNQR